MSELRELYQEVILDHSKAPRNCRKLEGADGQAEGYNPLCGDRLTVYVRQNGDEVSEICFEGTGCAISMASASMMTQALSGIPAGDVQKKFEDFHALVTGKLGTGEAPSRLGKLAVFAGVRDFPVRVKCATLAWHTLRAAISNSDEPVTTE